MPEVKSCTRFWSSETVDEDSQLKLPPKKPKAEVIVQSKDESMIPDPKKEAKKPRRKQVTHNLNDLVTLS